MRLVPQVVLAQADLAAPTRARAGPRRAPRRPGTSRTRAVDNIGLPLTKWANAPANDVGTMERGRGHGRRVRVRRWSRPGDGPTRRSSGSRVGAGRPAAPARAPAALRRLPEPLLQAPVVARPEGPRASRPAGRGAGPPPAGRGPDGGHGQRPGLQPGPGRERLAVGAHRRPDRHRRHALPRRLRPHGDDGDGARHPPRHPPDAPGGPRRRHVRPGRGGDRERGLDLRRGRPLRRHAPGAAAPAPRRRARRRPRRGDRLAADAGPLRPAGPRAGAQRAAARHGRGDAARRSSCAGSATTTSSSSATGSTTSSTRPRTTTSSWRCPAPGWVCCATAGGRRSRTGSRR